jgi:multisubunit Na+/H+ antiporter MnhB subunit
MRSSHWPNVWGWRRAFLAAFGWLPNRRRRAAATIVLLVAGLWAACVVPRAAWRAGLIGLAVVTAAIGLFSLGVYHLRDRLDASDDFTSRI